jgi:hypothetical protein
MDKFSTLFKRFCQVTLLITATPTKGDVKKFHQRNLPGKLVSSTLISLDLGKGVGVGDDG